MSYLEKKYLKKIEEIFELLKHSDAKILEVISKKSIKNVDQYATMCAEVNKNINLILKKYYPEIKGMDDKLKIKAKLKFYYDLLDKLTDLVRHIENFDKIDDQYFNIFIDFIKQRDYLISGKYQIISKRELTAFYDPATRNALEEILAEKIERKSSRFFAMGPLEEEIKKIGKIAGADSVKIKQIKIGSNSDNNESDRSVIEIRATVENEEEKTERILNELKSYLESKKYAVRLKDNKLITNAELLPDKN